MAATCMTMSCATGRSVEPTFATSPLKAAETPLRELLPPTHGPWPPVNALTALERLMHRRISHEEGPAGLFAFVCRAAPRYVSLIDHLRLEHERILLGVKQLHVRARHLGDPHQLSAELDALIDAIEDHDAFEREILRDSIEG